MDATLVETLRRKTHGDADLPYLWSCQLPHVVCLSIYRARDEMLGDESVETLVLQVGTEPPFRCLTIARAVKQGLFHY